MSVMKDTTGLRPYNVSNSPALSGSEKIHLFRELNAIQDSIQQLVVAAKALETRLVAGGL